MVGHPVELAFLKTRRMIAHVRMSSRRVIGESDSTNQWLYLGMSRNPLMSGFVSSRRLDSKNEVPGRGQKVMRALVQIGVGICTCIFASVKGLEKDHTDFFERAIEVLITYLTEPPSTVLFAGREWGTLVGHWQVRSRGGWWRAGKV